MNKQTNTMYKSLALMNLSKPYSRYRMNKNVLQPEIKIFFYNWKLSFLNNLFDNIMLSLL